MTEELTQAVVDLREDDALAMVDRLLAEGADPVGILDACKQAMDVIGERFAGGEAFIPELIMAGEIM
ncbi:MAG: B12-binding domain-containing protein, partial [Thermoleophilia bacterium]|nr:B12-binding domain-containing protein [Thermoleophilia bacterium]